MKPTLPPPWTSSLINRLSSSTGLESATPQMEICLSLWQGSSCGIVRVLEISSLESANKAVSNIQVPDVAFQQPILSQQVWWKLCFSYEDRIPLLSFLVQRFQNTIFALMFLWEMACQKEIIIHNRDCFLYIFQYVCRGYLIFSESTAGQRKTNKDKEKKSRPD